MIVAAHPKFKQLYLPILFTIGFIISSNVTIPFYPVPFTLQTFIFLIAIFYNVEVALKSAVFYVALGVLGLPVFASWSNGLVAFSTPHAGYIVGLLLATALVAFLKPASLWIRALVFYAVLFICGVGYLASLLGVKAALYDGFLLFVIPEILKTIAARQVYRFIK